MYKSSSVPNVMEIAFTADIYALVHRLLQRQLHWKKVYHIVGAAVGIETKFVCEALPCALIGMNTMLVGEYIKFVADHLLVFLHLYPALLFCNSSLENEILHVLMLGWLR